MMNEDETVGRNVRTLRDAAGISQSRLAEAMTEVGLTGFYPQTITKIEQGSRSLKLTEGLHLARILGVEPEDLYDPGTPDVPTELRAAVRAIGKAWDDARDAAFELRVTHHNLEMLLEDADTQAVVSQSAKATELVTNARAWTLDSAINDAKGIAVRLTTLNTEENHRG